MSDRDPSRQSSQYDPTHERQYDPTREGHSHPPVSGNPPPALPLEKEDRIWAAAAHASGPASVVVSAGYLPFLGPLVVWLVKRDENVFVAGEAKEALNFQITILLLNLAGVFLSFVTCTVGLIVYLPFAFVIAVGSFVLGILASIQAYDGKPYRYPFTWRLIK